MNQKVESGKEFVKQRKSRNKKNNDRQRHSDKSEDIKVVAHTIDIEHNVSTLREVIATYSEKQMSQEIDQHGPSDTYETKLEELRKKLATDNLTTNQKSKLKIKVKKVMQQIRVAKFGINVDPKDPFEDERVSFCKDFERRLDEVPLLSEIKQPQDILAMYGQVKASLDELENELKITVADQTSKVRKPEKHLKKEKRADVLKKINDELSIMELTDVTESSALEGLLSELEIISQWNNYAKFTAKTTLMLERLQKLRKENQNLVLDARIEDKKQSQIDTINYLKSQKYNNFVKLRFGTTLVTKTCPFPMGNQNAVAVIRRLTRKFDTIIDYKKAPSSNKTLSITGLESDVNKCIEFIQLADFNPTNKIKLEKNHIGSLIGSGGSNIKKIEDTYDVIIIIESNNFTPLVIGTPENINRAVTNIKETIQVVKLQLTPPCCRALQSLCFNSIRDIENKYNAEIIIGKGINEDPENGVVRIKAKMSEAETIKNMLEMLIQSFYTQHISLPKHFRNAGALVTNIKLQQSPNVFTTLDGNRIVFFSTDKQELDKAVELANVHLMKVTSKPVVINCHSKQISLFMRSTIKSQLQTKFNVDINRNGNSIHIVGSEESKAAAEKEVREFMDDEAHLKAIDLNTLKVAKEIEFLLMKLANKYLIDVELRDGFLKLIGQKGIVDIAEKEVRELDVTKKTIDTSSIKFVIGLKGKNIQRILDESQVLSIDVKQNGDIMLVGTSEAIKVAMNNIDDIVKVTHKSVVKEEKNTKTQKEINRKIAAEELDSEIFYPPLIQVRNLSWA